MRQGIRDIRLTGGEPLLRPDLADVVAELSALRPLGLSRIAVTTNGSPLSQALPALRAAGLDDLNISLDSVDPARFRDLTGGELAPVLAGIDAAEDLGVPFKLNSVLVRGHNEAEILPLTAWALARGETATQVAIDMTVGNPLRLCGRSPDLAVDTVRVRDTKKLS